LESQRRRGIGLKDQILEAINESIKTKELLRSNVGEIARFAEMVLQSLRASGKVILFGNGGSAADAQHIAAEFIGRYAYERKAYPALALSSNISLLTALGNDYGFDHVFDRQVEALCTKNDVVVGISTSGNSKNVILGMSAAREKGAKCVAMTGESGGNLAKIADLTIRIPSKSTPRIQESHILVGHIVSGLVEKALSTYAELLASE